MQNVKFSTSIDDGTTPIVVGADNKTLSVIPMMNTGYSVLNDVKCEICNKNSYNSSSNWTADGKKTQRSHYISKISEISRESSCVTAFALLHY